MKNLLLSISHYFERLPNQLRPWRWGIIIFALASTIFMAVGSSKFVLDVTLDSWFNEDDPVVQSLDEFRNQFGSDDGLFIVYEAKDGDVFSPTSLRLVDQLTRNLSHWQDIPQGTLDAAGITDELAVELAHIKRVQSLTNVRIQVNQGDTLSSPRLIQNLAMQGAEAEAVKTVAMAQSNLPLFLFSKNHRYGAIMVTTDFGAVPLSNSLEVANDNLMSGDDLELDEDFGEELSSSFDVSATQEKVRFEDMDSGLYLTFMEAVSRLYKQPEFEKQFNFYPIGNASMVELAVDDMMQAGMLLLGMVLVINILLWTLFHSASAVLWPQVAIGISALFVVGTLGWLGIESSTLISLTVMLIVAVGVADCVHVMSSYMYFRRNDYDHELALSKAYGKTGLPILLTTITTMAGMGALTITGMTQFVVFGVTSAAGVLLAFLYTIFLLPALMDLWHPMPKEKPDTPKLGWRLWGSYLVWPLVMLLRLIWRLLWPVRLILRLSGVQWLLSGIWLQGLLDKIPAFVQQYKHGVNFGFISLFIVCLYGASQVKVDSNIAELYREGAPLRTAYTLVDEHMMGTGSLEILVDMQQSDALMQTDVLQTMDRLQRHIENKYSTHVIRTNSLADLVKDTHSIMQDGSDFYRTIPDNNLAVSQLLYLFNSSNPDERRALVNDDYSQSHISVQLRNAGSSEYAEFFELVQLDIQQAFAGHSKQYPNMDVHVTGTLALMMRLMDDMSNNQFKSLALAMVLISGLLVLTLGSVQAGLMSIIPNMIPATLAFGLMGLMGIPLDTDTLMIAPLIIGIAVDDTIHFITHYRMALVKHSDMRMALVDTIKEVGQAVTFTSLVLGCGFFMLSFSNYLGLAKVGAFGSLAIFVALLCDLLFFPALIMVFKPKFGQEHVLDNLDFHGTK
ncbi:MAG: MMPL family transporter [Gammaproteobacteria bacterium]|nr:MMPL family transporter [Gammaproteobacteria bacterium]